MQMKYICIDSFVWFRVCFRPFSPQTFSPRIPLFSCCFSFFFGYLLRFFLALFCPFSLSMVLDSPQFFSFADVPKQVIPFPSSHSHSQGWQPSQAPVIQVGSASPLQELSRRGPCPPHPRPRTQNIPDEAQIPLFFFALLFGLFSVISK